MLHRNILSSFLFLGLGQDARPHELRFTSSVSAMRKCLLPDEDRDQTATTHCIDDQTTTTQPDHRASVVQVLAAWYCT
jgi:hypothetical protein